MKTLPFLLVAGLLLAGSSILAQEGVPVDTTQVDSLVADTVAGIPDTTPAAAPVDTVRYRRTEELDRFRPAADTVNLESHLYQNPTIALFKSALIPGWGQFGNRSYIKGVLFLGLDAWMVYSAVDYGREAADLKDQFEAATSIDERNELYERYDGKRSERNKYTWFAVIISFVAMFDAYVDAHLSGFPDMDRQPDLSFDFGPDKQGGVQASVTVPF